MELMNKLWPQQIPDICQKLKMYKAIVKIVLKCNYSI